MTAVHSMGLEELVRGRVACPTRRDRLGGLDGAERPGELVRSDENPHAPILPALLGCRHGSDDPADARG